MLWCTCCVEQVPDAPGPVAVTVDGASVSVTVDGAAADVQEEQVELVAERIEALRAQQEDEVGSAIRLQWDGLRPRPPS